MPDYRAEENDDGTYRIYRDGEFIATAVDKRQADDYVALGQANDHWDEQRGCAVPFLFIIVPGLAAATYCISLLIA